MPLVPCSVFIEYVQFCSCVVKAVPHKEEGLTLNLELRSQHYRHQPHLQDKECLLYSHEAWSSDSRTHLTRDKTGILYMPIIQTGKIRRFTGVCWFLAQRM